MAKCSDSRFKPLDKPIRRRIYYRQRKQKHSSKNEAGCEATYCISAGEKRTEEINRYVTEFIVGVKRKNGQGNEPSSFRGLFSRVQPVFKGTQVLSEYNIIEDITFYLARECLYEKNLLGISNAEALPNTVWLFNSVHLALEAVKNIGR